MEKFFIKEQIFATTFSKIFLETIKSEDEMCNVIIMIQENDNEFHYFLIPIDMNKDFKNKYTAIKTFNLLKKYFTEGYKYESIFSLCQRIFPFIEIVLEDFHDNIIINSNEIAESNISFLKGKFFEITLDLVQSKYAATDLNIYYRENSIEKFKFQKFPIEYDAGKFENLNHCIRNYFQNIRAFLSCIICQIFYFVQFLKSKCGEYIINDRKEIYYGTVQRLKCPEIISLMKNVDPYMILSTFQYMNVNTIDSKKCFSSDMEIWEWTSYMANIQPHLEEIENYESVKADIEKFYILIAFSYHNYLSTVNTFGDTVNLLQETIKDKVLLIQLISDCFQIIKSEWQSNSKISKWIIYNIIKIFNFNHFVNFFILGEVYNRTIIIINDKSKNLVSKFKIEELYKISEMRNIKESEIKNLIKILENDIYWISNTIKFIMHIAWLDQHVIDIKNLCTELEKIKGKLKEFQFKLTFIKIN